MGYEKAKAWQKRRSSFNHNWLQNKYIPALGKWQNLLSGKVKDSQTGADFSSVILSEWESHCNEARKLVDDYTAEMSPVQLFDCEPLIRCGERLKCWLRPVIHELWKVRHSVDERISDVKTSFHEANSIERCLASELERCGKDAPLEKLQVLENILGDFHKACFTLGATINKLENRVRVT